LTRKETPPRDDTIGTRKTRHAQNNTTMMMMVALLLCVCIVAPTKKKTRRRGKSGRRRTRGVLAFESRHDDNI
jgi:hypothetical protein